MIRYNITFNGADTIGGAVNATVLPLMAQAVRAVAQTAASNWQESVMRGRMWSGEKDAYAQSIKWEMTGDFSAFVSSDYKNAAEIENGRPARDLKKMLDTSLKVRRTKNGKRFLVIPMRHNASGSSSSAMPTGVASLASEMAPSRIVGQGSRPSGQVTHLSPKTGMSPAAKQTLYLSSMSSKKAATVTRNSYAWGDRITKAQLKAAGMGAAEQKRYSGMVRMDASTPGGSKSSSFLTFRIMMENSRGWVIPAQPGQYLLRTVAQELEPKATAAFAAAIAKSIKP